MKEFKNHLREIRKAKGYTQKEVAVAANVARRNYQEWEYGNTKPGFDYLVDLAEFFEISLDYLVGRSNNPEMNKQI